MVTSEVASPGSSCARLLAPKGTSKATRRQVEPCCLVRTVEHFRSWFAEAPTQPKLSPQGLRRTGTFLHMVASYTSLKRRLTERREAPNGSGDAWSWNHGCTRINSDKIRVHPWFLSAGFELGRYSARQSWRTLRAWREALHPVLANGALVHAASSNCSSSMTGPGSKACSNRVSSSSNNRRPVLMSYTRRAPRA